jgi:hypothetical protein
MKSIPDFENDPTLTKKQKARRRFYYANRDKAIAQASAWCSANPEKTRAHRATSKLRNRGKNLPKARAYTQRYRAEHPLYQQQYYYQNRDEISARVKVEHQKLKQETINAYGGRCVCCGETSMEFLCLDHIHNDGHVERKGSSGSGRAFYSKLKRQGFPKDRIQVLCQNCNSAKGHYGYCPHQRDAALLFGLKYQSVEVRRAGKRPTPEAILKSYDLTNG